jgi:hypothetical protein
MRFSQTDHYKLNIKQMQLVKNTNNLNNYYMLITDVGNFYISVLDHTYTINVYNINRNRNSEPFTTEMIGTWILLIRQQKSTTRDGMEISWSYQ